MTTATAYRLDCRPSLTDHRDYQFAARLPNASVPDIINIDAGVPYDQGQEGSCTGNAQAKLVWVLRKQFAQPVVELSRAMIYYLSRLIEGTQNQDSGSTLADSFAGLYKWGACSEGEFPYIPGDFARAPTSQQYANALPYRITAYEQVALTPDMIGQALAAGRVVSIGFSVPTSFLQTGPDGIIPAPSGRIEGGHNVLITGQRRTEGLYRGINSWGTGWGDHGYFWMRSSFLFSSLVWEARTASTVFQPEPAPPQPTPVPPVPTEEFIDGIGFHGSKGSDERISAADLFRLLKARV